MEYYRIYLMYFLLPAKGRRAGLGVSNNLAQLPDLYTLTLTLSHTWGKGCGSYSLTLVLSLTWERGCGSDNTRVFMFQAH